MPPWGASTRGALGFRWPRPPWDLESRRLDIGCVSLLREIGYLPAKPETTPCICMKDFHDPYLLDVLCLLEGTWVALEISDP